MTADTPAMTFRIVRKEPSEAMEEAADAPFHAEFQKQAKESRERHGEVALHSGGFSVPMFRAMLAASEPPTDAEIDELCVAYCPEHWTMQPDGMTFKYVSAEAKMYRDSDRARMRAFLDHLS